MKKKANFFLLCLISSSIFLLLVGSYELKGQGKEKLVILQAENRVPQGFRIVANAEITSCLLVALKGGKWREFKIDLVEPIRTNERGEFTINIPHEIFQQLPDEFQLQNRIGHKVLNSIRREEVTINLRKSAGPEYHLILVVGHADFIK